MPPRTFLVDRPTKQSVMIAGRYINIRLLAQHLKITKAYCSRVMDGSSIPSLPLFERIATTLKMDLVELKAAITLRHSTKLPKKVA